MGTFELSAEATFSAAHTLPGVEMCDRLHGHNWRVQATVRVAEDALDQVGMGVDFRTLERLVREVVEPFEHRHLNELADFANAPPSAERIARVVHDRLSVAIAGVNAAATVVEVTLWEMPQYRVTYRPA